MPAGRRSGAKEKRADGDQEVASKAAQDVRGRAQEFLRSMYAAESAIVGRRDDMSKEQWKECIASIFAWLDSTDDLPKACLTRDVGREILAQLSAVVMISGYRGEPGAYIA